MKRKATLALSIIVLSCITLLSRAQNSFHGAVPQLKQYKALYYINTNEDKHIRATIRNINNAIKDSRLQNKLTIELVAFGDGVAVFQKANNYDSLLLDLKSKGVILAQCENTLHERNIPKTDILDFISFVPSGNGEIIIRAQEGWATVHP
ncbi:MULTISPECIES: DsrE family protein [Chitinophagaceae]